MKITELVSKKEISLTSDMRLCCALGNFDGVHIGHAALLRASAQKLGNATHSAVWTFAEPPSASLGKNVKILTPPPEKLEIFEKFGIDVVITEEFEKVRALSPNDFVKNVLFETCHVNSVICGYNFRFGKNASGNADMLSDIMSSLGGEARIIPRITLGGTEVSSTAIRKLIESGNVAEAGKMLGRPYSVNLPVLHGKRLGQKLGMPTINQSFPNGFAVPRRGVYATVCEYNGKEYAGVSNVGVRPTVDKNGEVNLETHIVGFDGELYGEDVCVKFHEFIRPEMKFEDTAALAAQMKKDMESAVEFFRRKGGKNAYFKT